VTPSARLGAAVLGALAVAVGWTLAATSLWRTTVPAHLKLAHVSLTTVLAPALLHRAEHFSSVERLLGALQIVALVVALLLYARFGGRFAQESAAGRIGTGMLLAMLGFAVVWIAELPFGLADLWWQRRYGVAHTGYISWVVANWLALGGMFVFICAGVLVVMALAKPLGDNWWIAASPVFVGLMALNVVLTPWLLGFPTRPLRDRALIAAEHRLAAREHVAAVPLRVVDLGDEPNAFAIGVGATRRIVIYESFFKRPFDEAEREFVIAHELGHHAHKHLFKDIGLFALFTVPGAFVLARITRLRGGMADPAAVPLALLVYTLLTLLTLPLQNAYSRRFEAEADWSALQATRDPTAGARLFRDFVPATLEDPSPPGWDAALLESHPTLEQRVGMVEAWRRQNG
jgi:STE24 endopeptidase